MIGTQEGMFRQVCGSQPSQVRRLAILAHQGSHKQTQTQPTWRQSVSLTDKKMSRKMHALDVKTSMQVIVKIVVTTIKPTVTQPQRRQCVSAAQNDYILKALGIIIPMQAKIRFSHNDRSKYF